MQKVTTKVCCIINLKTSLDAASFADQNALFIEVQFKWECLKILKIQIGFNDWKPQNDHNKDWSIWPSSPCLQSSIQDDSCLETNGELIWIVRFVQTHTFVFEFTLVSIE